MVGLFVIILLAALVGIIKPYINGMRRGHFALAAIISFVCVGIFGPKADVKSNSVKSADSTPTSEASPATLEAAASDAPKAPTTKWAYSDDKDAMRGTTTHYASLDSENEVDLDFPYGVVRGKLWIRKRPEDGLNVMFSVEKGQVLCNSFSGTTVSIKFDDGPIRKFRCTSSSDGSSETAFLEPQSAVLAGLKKAHHVVVEAEFFQKGRQQFEFQTAGLDWKG